MHDAIEDVRAKIKRWRSKQKRAQTALDKLYRQEKRLLTKPVERKQELNLGLQVETPPLPKPADPLAIPDFMRRTPLSDTAKKLMAEDAEKKKDRAAKRAKARKSVKDAKLTGATRKMPLSGKAAMDFLR